MVFCIPTLLLVLKTRKLKIVRIRDFSGSHFPICGLFTERYCISPYSVRMWENTDQKNSRYGHFLRSALLQSVYRAKGPQDLLRS